MSIVELLLRPPPPQEMKSSRWEPHHMLYLPLYWMQKGSGITLTLLLPHFCLNKLKTISSRGNTLWRSSAWLLSHSHEKILDLCNIFGGFYEILSFILLNSYTSHQRSRTTSPCIFFSVYVNLENSQPGSILSCLTCRKTPNPSAVVWIHLISISIYNFRELHNSDRWYRFRFWSLWGQSHHNCQEVTATKQKYPSVPRGQLFSIPKEMPVKIEYFQIIRWENRETVKKSLLEVLARLHLLWWCMEAGKISHKA